MTKSFTVTKGAQTIAFTQPANTAISSGPVALSATATSSLLAASASTTAAVCTVSGTSVTLVSVGLCSIDADQVGDSNYNAAARVTKSFNVTIGSQTISFTNPPDTALSSGPVALAATATSSLVVSFTSTTLAVCTVSGTSVTLVKVGTCTINADQAGDSNYAAAPQVTESFNVTIGSQTISFTQPADTALTDGPVTLTATATSGLVVSFTSTTLAVCTVTGTSVTLVSLGTCTIDADQAGDSNYTAAPTSSESFVVKQGGATSTLDASVNPSVFGQPVTLTTTIAVNASGAGKPSGTATFKRERQRSARERSWTGLRPSQLRRFPSGRIR